MIPDTLLLALLCPKTSQRTYIGLLVEIEYRRHVSYWYYKWTPPDCCETPVRPHISVPLRKTRAKTRNRPFSSCVTRVDVAMTVTRPVMKRPPKRSINQSTEQSTHAYRCCIPMIHVCTAAATLTAVVRTPHLNLNLRAIRYKI